MRRVGRSLAMILLVGNLLVTNRSTVAEDAPSDSVEKQNIEAAFTMTRAAAGKYEFETPDEDKPLVLREQPILRWSNPERGQIYGNVFLWTNRGRPVVVGSLYKWFSPFTHMAHEFHSLSRGEIGGSYEGKEVWRSIQPGVVFAAVPGAPAVATTQVGRLIQMRQIARQCSARSVDRDGLKLELRQLAQPVYRYEIEKDSPHLLDGALFVFVQGTDPEVWLLLEAVPAGNSAEWQYALVRMNSIELAVEHDGQAVWHCEKMRSGVAAAHKSAYTTFYFHQP